MEDRGVKLSAKTRSTLFLILFLSAVIGTLAWEVLERLITLLGMPLDLSVGPVGLDVYVLSVTVRANPGTILGVLPGIAIFRRL